jgi:hypothetical protein
VLKTEFSLRVVVTENIECVNHRYCIENTEALLDASKEVGLKRIQRELSVGYCHVVRKQDKSIA